MWYSKFMKFKLTSFFTKEDTGYSVLCPELGVASQGETIFEAKKNIKEAIELFIEDIDNATLQKLTSSTSVQTFEIEHA